jgi:hypothetical protein
MKLTETSVRLGYRHPEYAQSFKNEGHPRLLEYSQGWIVERQAPFNGRYIDAMGLYPLFSCKAWNSLPLDLELLRESDLVNLVLVTDPLLNDSERRLFTQFEVVRPFKTHYLAELKHSPEQTVSKHHAYYARKAAKEIDVEVVENPLSFLDEWQALYAQLIARYKITDMRTFSKDSFAKLLGMPDVFLYRALRKNRLVGSQIVLLQDDVAFAHLAAFTDEGYKLSASYILDWYALEHLRGKARIVNWGGGSSLTNIKKDGLAQYKRGWSTQQRTSYILGTVFDQTAYAKLCKEACSNKIATYFPVYRYDEFG